MNRLLFIFLLFFTACGQSKSSQDSSAVMQDSVRKASNSVLQKKLADSLHITKKFVTGQFDYHHRDDFVKVNPQDANKEVYLQKRTYNAFKAMEDSAREAGIRLIIVSGTRNFNYQKAIWDRKWDNSDAPTDSAKAVEILQFSSMPMTSRHHWGTDIDLNNLNNSYFKQGKGKKEYQWLKTHANNFGFYQVYTNKKLHGRTGYEMEKWHWSYMPLADPYLKYYNNHVTNEYISGFKGSDLAPRIDMVKNYVNGVSQKIKNYGRLQK